MNQQYYIYSRILPVLISACCIEFNHYKREFTLLQYSTTLSSIITSFCIIFDICYMMNLQFYIYSRILPVLISTCCIEFNHYKTWIYCITVFYNTLKHNHIILYHIWYLLHDEPTVLYIFQNTPSIDFKHAVLNLITTRREFTLLQYSKTLSSIITSFCIIFDICYMMNQQYYIYSRILPVLISACCIEFNHYKREFTLLQYSTTLSSIITSFCIIFDICTWWTNSSIYIPEYSQYWFQHAVLNLITTKREFTVLQYSTTLSSLITSFCIIFDICYMMNQQYYIYSRILPVLISTCCNQFNH